jgi:hypothetical protein
MLLRDFGKLADGGKAGRANKFAKPPERRSEKHRNRQLSEVLLL